MKRSKELLADDKRFDRVHRLLDPWMHRLSLSAWDVRFVFLNKCDTEEAAMEVTSGLPYLHLTIEVNRGEMDKASDEELTHTLLHEVMHVVLFGPLQQFIKDNGLRCDAYDRLNETAVDLVTRFLLAPHIEESRRRR